MPFYEGRILGDPTVSRRMVNTQYGPVEIQDVTVEVENVDGTISGDLRATPFTLDLYDTVTGVAIDQWTGVVADIAYARGRLTITGTNLDLSTLETPVPVGLVEPTTFPLADGDAVGKCIPWVFGNVASLPLLNLNDGVVASEFDYGICRREAAAIRGMRRLARDAANAAQASFDIAYDELEPYPGMDGVIEDPSFEDWDSGSTSPPGAWTLAGAGATIAKNTTDAEVSEGDASASVTRVGTDCRLSQNIQNTAEVAGLVPLSWWYSREITVIVDVFATVASRAFIRVNDGPTTFDSPFHTGGGTYESLVVGTSALPCVISAAATRVRVECWVVTGNTTVHFDNVRVYLRAKSWAEIPRPDLYEGKTAVRFFLRQEDSSGGLHPIVADVNGLQPERNPVRAIRTILSDSDHGLGKTAEAASFDAKEIDATFTYDDAVRLDDPQVYLSFRDALAPDNTLGYAPLNGVARDRSGHERHATQVGGSTTPLTYQWLGLQGQTIAGPSGDTNDAFIDCNDGAHFVVPYDYHPTYDSTTACSLEVWYYIDDTDVQTSGAGADQYCLIEKRIGATGLSGRTLEHVNRSIGFAVRSDGGSFSEVTFTLTDVEYRQRWLHIVGTAEGGVLSLYIDGVVKNTDTYPGALDVGAGDFDVGRYGTGIVPTDTLVMLARPALYTTALSAARVAAHHTAIVRDVEPPSMSIYDDAILALAPTFAYRLLEATSTVDMTDEAGGHSGVWVGSPVSVTTESPLAAERGVVNLSAAKRFKNKVAQYGIETGMTLNDAAATIAGWYKPTVLRAKGGLVEMTVGSPGVRDTHWGLCHNGARIRFTLVRAASTLTLDAPLLAEDVGRWTFIVATWDGAGAARVYKNGTLAVEGTYDATPLVVPSGDFYVGIQGSFGGSTRTRPCRGYLSRWSYHPTAFTADDVAELWRVARWYNGGLCVDMALTEPRQAQGWIQQITRLRGIRLGLSTAGAWTVVVDTAASAPTVTLRDGPGDGVAPNLLGLSDRRRPSLKDAIKDFVLQYRKDLVTGAYLCEQRIAISTVVDANGDRIGQDWIETSDALRTEPAAGRAAGYITQYMIADETVTAAVEPIEGQPLFEGMQVQVIDPALNYSGDTLLIREVRKRLSAIELLLAEAPTDAFTYAPTAFPASPGPEV